MNRLLLLILALLATTAAWSQTALVQTKVYASDPGFAFYVDDTFISGTASFMWPVGSKHHIYVPASERSALDNTGTGMGGDTYYALNSVSNDLGPVWQGTTNDGNIDIWITAQAGVTFFRADVSVSYRMRVFVTPCTAANNYPTCDKLDPNQAGYVVVDNSPIYTDTYLWFAAKSKHTFQAVPQSGFVFNFWTYPGGTNPSGQISLPINNPFDLTTNWTPGIRYTFNADPAGIGLLLTVDTTTLTPPHEIDFIPNSAHVIGAKSPQVDNTGRLWVFQGWDNGLANNATLQVDNMANVARTLTAKFSPAAKASFVTDPSGLKLVINGRDNWPGYNFVGTVGTTWNIQAPLQQIDAAGRTWTFAGWSNGGDAAQTVGIDQSNLSTGINLVAKYTGTSHINILTNPAGIPLQVDGNDCPSPCAVDRPAGAQIVIAAPRSVPTGDTTRLDLTSWSDGGSSASHSFTVGASTTLTANYTTSYHITTLMDPAGAASIQMSPSSPDGYYAANTLVTLTAAAQPGYRFRQWDGDMTSVGRVLSMNLNSPMVVRALLDRTPYIAPNSVRNAAGSTPDGVVAPGSIISIFGAGLSNDLQTGPASPLAQTLGGVTASFGGYILPLFFVSPSQINAYLPSTVQLGTYALTVNSDSLSPVTTKFTVARNAPGLFTQGSGDQSYVSALHQDGSQVTPDSPAQRGETITIYGTGFGPYTTPLPDGYAVPASPTYTLADPVDVVVGDNTVVQPVQTTAAPGMIGVVAMQLKIGDPLPSATTVNLRVRINGEESNTVQLPLQ